MSTRNGRLGENKAFNLFNLIFSITNTHILTMQAIPCMPQVNNSTPITLSGAGTIHIILVYVCCLALLLIVTATSCSVLVRHILSWSSH